MSSVRKIWGSSLVVLGLVIGLSGCLVEEESDTEVEELEEVDDVALEIVEADHAGTDVQLPGRRDSEDGAPNGPESHEDDTMFGMSAPGDEESEDPLPQPWSPKSNDPR
jgi:hypothetical protein